MNKLRARRYQSLDYTASRFRAGLQGGAGTAIAIQGLVYGLIGGAGITLAIPRLVYGVLYSAGMVLASQRLVHGSRTILQPSIGTPRWQ